MVMGSFLFKQKAREALKGKWQNALVVSFFSGLFLTIAQLLQTTALQGVQNAQSSLMTMMSTVGSQMTNEQAVQWIELYNRYLAEINSVPSSTWITLLAVNLLALVVTPALTVSCNRYFVSLIRGSELGVREGLTGRLNIWFKALWLHVRMFVQIFLWSLLFFIPGIIAAIRYSMAPYYMADDPTLSAGDALRKSKEVMKGRKGTYFMLLISFVGWNLLISIVQMMLGGMLGTVLMLVAAQFMTLALNTYINAATAAFYNAFATEYGVRDLYDTMRRRMRQAGISDNEISAAGFGDGEDVTIEEDADGGEDE